MQLRESDVNRGREGGQGGDEPQFAFVTAEAQRYREAAVVGLVWQRGEVAFGLGDERAETIVRASQGLREGSR